MKNNKKTTLVVMTILIISGMSRIQAQPVSLFADPKARNVGDVLTVLIQENASATNNTATSTNKSNETSISSTVPGAGNLLKFIPLHSLESDFENRFQGRASTSRSARITARMTVLVAEKKSNGDLVVEGVRVLKINGEREAIALTGVVSPASIGRDNTVLSSSIADLQVEYTGKGTSTQGSRPGIIVRLVNWVF
jgi:flagellar L-ring protein precursor FlgH